MADKQAFKDAFSVGTYRVKVYKTPEWENNKRIEGSHKSGEGQYGKWYLYDVKYGDKYYSLFGNEKNKALLDSGDVSLNIWFSKGKKGVEVLHPDDIMAQEQNVKAIKQQNDAKNEDNRKAPLPEPPPGQDNTQDRIIRGMCFNNACVLISQNNKFEAEYQKSGVYDSKRVVNVAKELSREFYEQMKDWLAGREKFSDEDKINIEDLPF